jgi:hypothetical protein
MFLSELRLSSVFVDSSELGASKGSELGSSFGLLPIGFEI